MGRFVIIVSRSDYFLQINLSRKREFLRAEALAFASHYNYDLRGCHILPLDKVVGLNSSEETIEISEIKADLELDLVTHEVKKFLLLLLKKNGYVLEQLYSPLVVKTTPEHRELKKIATGCITRHHRHHYIGFAKSSRRLFNKSSVKKIKPLLYIYRVLLTGIHLMNTGIVEANLVELNQNFKLPYLDDLIAIKTEGREESAIEGGQIDFFLQECDRLEAVLENAATNSSLPEFPSAETKARLNELLVRIRLQSI